jgi:hypothetical protein
MNAEGARIFRLRGAPPSPLRFDAIAPTMPRGMPAISKNTAPGCWRWWKNLPLKPVNKSYEKAFYKTENNCGINPALRLGAEGGVDGGKGRSSFELANAGPHQPSFLPAWKWAEARNPVFMRWLLEVRGRPGQAR